MEQSKLTEREKMARGDWYNCLDPALEDLRCTARDAVYAHNTLPPSERGALAPALQRVFAQFGPNSFVEAPFHCSYGINIHMGAGVYLNAGCTILDSGTVTLRDGAMLGPNVQIYCAEHHLDAQKRADGLEIARPVTIGQNAWIGGGAILLAGVTIGDAAIVGAGSVVTKSVPAGGRVVGNPARSL